MVGSNPRDRDPHAESVRASITQVVGGISAPPLRLRVGEQLTFGRDQTSDIRFSQEPRLSRLAGTVRGLPEGVAVTNLSATHALLVDIALETSRLASTTSGQPVSALLLTGGKDCSITWPGSSSSCLKISVSGVLVPTVRSLLLPEPDSSTYKPLRLSTGTKEFFVALLLCEPRLNPALGAVSVSGVPALTRQLLIRASSYRMLSLYDNDEDWRKKLNSRTQEHIKTLRMKLGHAGLADGKPELSLGAIVDLLIGNNVIQRQHLRLFDDPSWLGRQEIEWEG